MKLDALIVATVALAAALLACGVNGKPYIVDLDAGLGVAGTGAAEAGAAGGSGGNPTAGSGPGGSGPTGGTAGLGVGGEGGASPACEPDGSYLGAFTLISESAACDQFDPWFMYDDEVWTLSQGGTRLQAGEFAYQGSHANCISTFVEDFQGTRGDWVFNFDLEQPSVIFTLDRQMNGEHCILSWERILEKQ